MWVKILEAFPVLDDKVTNIFLIFALLISKHSFKGKYNKSECTEDQLKDVIEVLVSLKLENQFELWVFSKIEKILRQQIVPTFWLHFSDNQNEMVSFENFKIAIEELYNNLALYVPYLNQLQKLNNYFSIESKMNIIDKFKLCVRALLFSQCPPDHMSTLEHFYEVSFRVFCNLDTKKSGTQNLNTTTDGNRCIGCLTESNSCRCQNIYEVFCQTNRSVIIFKIF